MKRLIALFLVLCTLLSLCTMAWAAENNNFYLEFVSPSDPGHYVNFNNQVKYEGYSHYVKLYHKVGQNYIPIDADSLTSGDANIVSVQYCADDTYNVGTTGYYLIDQKAVGTATLSYTYTDGTQQSASYEYNVTEDGRTARGLLSGLFDIIEMIRSILQMILRMLSFTTNIR